MMKAPTNLIVLKETREKALELLTQRYAEDIIDDVEFERRLDLMERAETLEEIEGVLMDLINPHEPPQAREMVQRQPSALVAHQDVPRSQTLISLFSGSRRQGTWTPAWNIKALSVFGSSTLDFREARLGPGPIQVRVLTAFGGTRIIVPPGMPVINACTAIFGGVDQDRMVPDTFSDDGEAPRIILSGLVVFGGVDIREQLPGESWREAKKRHRAERKLQKKRAKLAAQESKKH